MSMIEGCRVVVVVIILRRVRYSKDKILLPRGSAGRHKLEIS